MTAVYGVGHHQRRNKIAESEAIDGFVHASANSRRGADAIEQIKVVNMTRCPCYFLAIQAAEAFLWIRWKCLQRARAGREELHGSYCSSAGSAR
ncbi:hypothetical protein CNECB9_2480037 [Cupriavidus necator]|uniref:Uncharacterized protein n=1 Tax=Cupriavidus necator TaxID=106590 RepID=A0A1K0IEI2_CUPNE|nr:hypothetical protein CNECB9_2480037 [Cupriavidus necator]